MAAQFEELTEEERRAEEERIRRLAGPPLKLALPPGLSLEGEPFEIPGSPNQAAVDNQNQLRLDVARDQLANLKGDETPEFLAKLRREAGVEPDNAAAPANNFSTFTPPPEADAGGFRGFLDDLGRNAVALPGRAVALAGRAKALFPRTQEAVAGAESRLRDVLEAEAELGGGEGPRAAGEEARLGVGAGVDLAVSAVSGVTRDIGAGIGGLIDAPLEFVSGLTGIGGLGGPPTANAQEETDVTGQIDTESGEQGEIDAAGAAEKKAQADAVKDEISAVPEVIDSPTTISNQPGVQSSVGGSSANRLLGPPLQPRDQRGTGIEVIRGTRQTFLPTDQEGRVTGSEIPFGRGTIQRFENAGFTLEQAGDIAIAAEEADARLINAGAQKLVAETNAVTPINIPLKDGSGRSVRGFQITDSDAPDGIRFFATDMLVPLSEDLFVTTTEINTTDATGRTTKLKKPMLLLETNEGGVSQFRHIPISSRQKRLLDALGSPGEFGDALQSATEEGLEGDERINRALELLENLVQEGQ